MTYAGFLALFLVLPIVVSWWWVGRAGAAWRRALRPLLAIVYVATTPWDNAAVARGLWDFDLSRTWGLRLGWLPVEEYLFFGLQTVLTGLWVARALARQVDGAA